MEIFRIVVLSLSGLLLTFVGGSRLGNPIKTYLKNSGIKLENDANLLNEIRGVSALMLTGGVFALLGIALPVVRPSSLLVTSFIFIGFAIGRIVSMKVDGKPNPKLIQGLIFELVFGALNITCLVMQSS